MTDQIKRSSSSTPYTLSKFYRRISTARPSAFLLAIAAIAFAIFMFGGGLYDVISRPLPAVYYNNQFIFLYPQLSEQFVSDSVVSMILYAFGVIGLILAYQSTKYAYKPRTAYLTFVVGAVLMVIAYVFLEITIQIKLG